MKKFVLRTLLFFIPFAVPVILYAMIDPFGVLYPENYRASVNRDFQSTELFLSNYKNGQYDSFIFGNSRSIYYQASSWRRFIDGQVFHFDASSESIYGINKKLLFLQGLKSVPVKNALIILDVSVIVKTDNSSGHLYLKHPKISEESNIKFEMQMFTDFIPLSMFAYTDFYLFKKSRPYMSRFIVCDSLSRLDVTTNELSYDKYDEQIKTNPAAYYNPRRGLFYPRDAVSAESKCCIGLRQKEILKSMRLILTSFKTNYKIIISPLYDQKRINREDLKYLRRLFGEQNVFDFSGKNHFTEPYTSYYETSHYRPVVCDSIMSLVYGHSSKP